MKNVLRRRPSASMVVAILALALGASGTAAAAGSLVSGNKLIKKHSLSGNRLVNHTITGRQINMSKLGTVPSATDANFATTAATATAATSAAISKVTYVANTVSVPATGTPTLATANCPTGTNVVGGGAQLSDEQDEVVNDSYPNGKTGWSADFVNGGSTAVNSTVTAICAPAAATAP